ncbi:glycosyl transferase [Pseudonocardiaceae bacterium YIM PH 21723]|nr:glycosyl transferase [Pseudonocardiaceae bacterium YIM PH 21723]
MTHIGFVCFPAYGHLNPVLAVARELVGRGHRVTIPAIAEFQEQVAASGAAAPLYSSPFMQGEEAKAMLAELKDKQPDRANPLKTMHSFLQEAFDTVPQFESIWDGDRPDVLVYDQSTFAGPMLADRWGVPLVGSFPALAANEHYSVWAEDYAKLDQPAEFAELDRFLADGLAGLGLPAQTLGVLAARQPDLGISFYTRSFQPRGETFDGYEFVGPCLTERVDHVGWKPSGDRPVLYVSLGSIFNHQPAFFRAVIEAFRDEPWQVVIAIGQHVRPEDLGEIPPNVELHTLAPQLEILAHTSVFISHCGMGGTQEALAFGVPLLGIPQMTEQEGNARRVAELGLGEWLPPTEVTAAKLREAVTRIAADRDIRDRLKEMRADIEAAGGARRAADLLEQRAL